MSDILFTIYSNDGVADWFVENDAPMKSILGIIIPLKVKQESHSYKYRIRIAYHNITFKSWEQPEKNEGRYDFCQTELKGCDAAPIIHMIPMDVFKDDKIRNKLKCCPRYYQIMDSSIWNNVVVLDTEEESKKAFREATRNIVENYDRGLYGLKIGTEYANLNARLLENAYIGTDDGKTAHSNFVSPFLFHSEQNMGRLIHEKLKPEGDAGKGLFEIIEKNKWRILLVDDYANKMLKSSDTVSEWSSDKQRKELCGTGKLNIIINDIQTIKQQNIAWCCPTDEEIKEVTESHKDMHSIYLWNNTSKKADINDFNISIFCVRNIKSALAVLKSAKFDIILLDYLLDEKPNKTGREYSYELLNEIQKEYDSVYRKECLFIREGKKSLNWIGPLNRLFFMHISAFVPAISERLEEQGLIRDTRYWHIARGACPTNTPYLFLYYLYCLMEKRHVEMGLDTELGVSGHTLLELLSDIFSSKIGEVKYKATTHFNALLNLRHQYDILKNDIFEEDFEEPDWLYRRGSLLVYSLFPDIQFYSNSFWEHIQQLVYLVAFGTVRQWPEMWEEYVFVRDRIKMAERENVSSGCVHLLSEKIEKYIIHLRIGR